MDPIVVLHDQFDSEPIDLIFSRRNYPFCVVVASSPFATEFYSSWKAEYFPYCTVMNSLSRDEIEAVV